MNQPVRILYVDDYPLDRELVRDALEKEHGGFELVEAASRPDFETALTRGRFDLILSDFNILGFEGLQVLETVQATGLNLPVIIVTGTGSEEVAAEAIKRGAADYVLKSPKHIQRLPHTIHAVLANKRLEDERRQAEEALRESNELLSLFMKHSPIYAFIKQVTPTESRVLMASENYQELVGIPGSKMTGMTMQELFPAEFAAKITADDWAVVSDGKVLKLDEDLNGRNYTSIKFPISLGSKNLMAGYTIDITERKQAEEKTLASLERERFLGNLVRDASVAIGVGYPDGRLGMCNLAFQKLTGYSEEELKKIAWNSVLTPPEWLESEMQSLAELHRTKQPVVYEKEYIHKGGKRVPIELVVHPFFDADRNVTHYYAFITNITERKQAEEKILALNADLEQRVEERTRELREAHEQLILQERLAVLGRLAGGVGHELRNPLSVILNAIYYLKIIQPDANEKTRQYYGMIEQEANIAVKIISDLLDFARIRIPDRQPVSVDELVRQTLERFTVPPSVKVTLKLPAGLSMVFADPRQMEQVLGHLVVNAYQAMTSGGMLTIQAVRRKKEIAIAVKDTGVGIPPENMSKLFEPLFTTRINGIGLGLAVSKKLAEANGGRIEVESVPGKGSTFILVLSVHEVER